MVASTPRGTSPPPPVVPASPVVHVPADRARVVNSERAADAAQDAQRLAAAERRALEAELSSSADRAASAALRVQLAAAGQARADSERVRSEPPLAAEGRGAGATSRQHEPDGASTALALIRPRLPAGGVGGVGGGGGGSWALRALASQESIMRQHTHAMTYQSHQQQQAHAMHDYSAVTQLYLTQSHTLMMEMAHKQSEL